MRIYCHGRILPQEEARISANDHGLFYGLALFETFRTFGGQPFLLQEHLERMRRGCEGFQIRPAPGNLLSEKAPSPALRRVLQLLLEENDLDDAVFRYMITAGQAPPGLPASPYSEPVEMIHLRPLPPPLPPEGQRLHLLDTPRDEPVHWPRPKSVNYSNSLTGHWELRERQTKPGDEGLMMTRTGQLAEGVVSNIFLLDPSGLATPSLASGILAGITRKTILHVARSVGLAAREVELGVDDLTKADAIFMTNSTRGIIPVHDVLDREGRSIWRRNSAAHPALRALCDAYAEKILGDTREAPRR
jgi:4-amino-4-deoxychorismate lyase